MKTKCWIAIFLILGFAGRIFACSCAPPPAPEKALEAATAVFIGEVTEKKEAEKYGFEFHFKVTEHWKGMKDKKVTVSTGRGGGDCGYNFKKGKKYLVYCYGEKKFSTNICTRTRPLERAKEDLKALGQGKRFSEKE